MFHRGKSSDFDLNLLDRYVIVTETLMAQSLRSDGAPILAGLDTWSGLFAHSSGVPSNPIACH
jgi:hypothetical protein